MGYRKQARLAAVALVAVLAAGCGGTAAQHGGSKAPMTLSFSWWGSTARDQAFLQAIKLFEQQHPNVTIQPEFSGSKGYNTKLDAELAAHDAPDVFTNGIGGTWDISPADRLSFKGLGIDTSGINPVLLQEATVNGVLQGVPNHLAIEAVIYDKTEFQKLGIPIPADNWTWQDFAQIAAEIHNKSGGKVAGATDIAAGFAPVNQAFEQYVLEETGHNLITASGLGVNATQLTNALTFWQQLQQQGAVTGAETTAALGTSQNEAVVSGVAAMDFVDVSTFTEFQGYTHDQLGLLPLPAGPYPGVWWVKAGNIYSISTTTKHPHTAAEFINFLTQDPAAVRAIGVSWGVPTSSAAQQVLVKQTNLGTANETALQFTEYVEQKVKAVPQPAQPANTPTFLKLLDQLEQKVAFNKETVPQAVQSLTTTGAADLHG